MKTRVTTISNLVLSLTFCLGLTACNKEDFYQKEYLETPFENPTTTGTVAGGQEGGETGTVGGTQGGVEAGVNGGTDGSTTGSSTSGTNPETTGGVDGSTTAGSTTGSTTAGVIPGTTTGGTTGSGYEEVSETFRQSAAPTKKLDILWVIDDSGSMANEQAALGTNFSAFINDFIDTDVDFKMAITTTDTSSANKKGKMVFGSDTKLTSAAAHANETQFKEDFKSMVKVGINGSGYEKGLEATEGFVNRYTDFLRPEAYLAVVIISDEQDQSPKAVNAYTDMLKGLKSEGGLIKVYSIVDIKGTPGVTGADVRYSQASKNTAGTIASIHGNFHTTLSDLGASIINLLDSFALSNNVVAGSLKVYVNGNETNSYTYDAASRSIKFNEGHVPPENAEIKVVYMK